MLQLPYTAVLCLEDTMLNIADRSMVYVRGEDIVWLLKSCTRKHSSKVSLQIENDQTPSNYFRSHCCTSSMLLHYATSIDSSCTSILA